MTSSPEAVSFTIRKSSFLISEPSWNIPKVFPWFRARRHHPSRGLHLLILVTSRPRQRDSLYAPVLALGLSRCRWPGRENSARGRVCFACAPGTWVSTGQLGQEALGGGRVSRGARPPCRLPASREGRRAGAQPPALDGVQGSALQQPQARAAPRFAA